MDDSKLVLQAYGEAVASLYSVFFESLAGAGADKPAELKAEESFKKGLAMARKARDKALELVK